LVGERVKEWMNEWITTISLLLQSKKERKESKLLSGTHVSNK
jgi:hypothetical protein